MLGEDPQLLLPQCRSLLQGKGHLDRAKYDLATRKRC